MLKLKVGVLVLTCALGASAMAGQPPPYRPSERPPYEPGAAQPVPAAQPAPAGQQPPYRPNARPGAWSMVISAPRS
jgi:hypothetical protein